MRNHLRHSFILFLVPQSLVGFVGEVPPRVRVEKQGAHHPLSRKLSQCGVPDDQVGGVFNLL